MDAARFLAEARERIDAALDRVLPPEATPPVTLHRAMRYSVFAGGKRLRPALALASGRLGDLPVEQLAEAASALELVHTYSLVHDDLPAMDDDDLRRGKPTCHVAFGEAHAILAGDALLTHAFEVLATHPAGAGLEGRRIAAVGLVARAAGPAGMVGGQTADLEHERSAGAAATPEALRFIHERKTGALIAASALLGGVLGGLAAGELERLERYGRAIGLAFQIADDVLDVEGSAQSLGKTAGKDARAHKLTYPALHGIDASKREAARLVEEAAAITLTLGLEARLLEALARFVVERRS